jgi:hypothetical protein
LAIQNLKNKPPGNWKSSNATGYLFCQAIWGKSHVAQADGVKGILPFGGHSPPYDDATIVVFQFLISSFKFLFQI